MAFVANCHWDLFVSCAHQDDQSWPGEKPGWVSQFVDALRGAVEAYLGEAIQPYVRPVTPSAWLLAEDLQAAENSATMLAIISPSYVRRQWQMSELAAFSQAHKDPRRIFVVEYLPLEPDEPYPPAIRENLRVELWQRLPGEEALDWLRPDSERYHAAVLNLAHAMARQLREMASRAMPASGKETTPGAAAPVDAKQPKSRIFLSYSSKDRDRVRPLANRLEEAGHQVWWDPHIGLGKPFRKVIAAQLEEADSILVAWSLNSIDSEWVQEEAEVGKRRGCLRPVLLDRVEPPIGFRSYQTLDISGWAKTGDDVMLTQLLGQLILRQ